jgi:glucose/arabinose dehydrogenase
LSFPAVFSRVVALVGGTALQLRRLREGANEPVWGSSPVIPAAKPQGAIPTLKMPTARGWSDGQTPVAAPGLKVNAFATGLDHPRWIQVLPNGDVLIAESMSMDRPPRSLFDYAMVSTMRRADAMGVSANRITLLRDADGDGIAETREVFLNGLNQPFGMALLGDTFYVGNTDGLVAFPYTPGATRISGPGRPTRHIQARRPLDAQPAAEPRRAEALCRRRLTHQYRRQRHGRRSGPRGHP